MQANPRAREASFASLSATWQKQQEQQAQVAEPHQAAHQQAHDVAGSHAAAVPALPEGWHAVWDARYNTYYYCHPASGTTTWELPDSSTAAAAAAPAVGDGTAPVRETAVTDSYTPTGFGAEVQAAAVAVEPDAQPHAAAVEQLASSSTVMAAPAAALPPAPQQQQPQPPQSTASGWYYHDPQGRECGPFTVEQLKGWRSGLPMSLVVWYREGPDAKQKKQQQRGAKRKRKAATAHLVQDLPQQPHQQLFGVVMPVQPQQQKQPQAPAQEGATVAQGTGERGSSEDDASSTSSSDDEPGVEFEIDSAGQLRVVFDRAQTPSGVDAKERQPAGEEGEEQQQQDKEEEEEEESPGACDAAAASTAEADVGQEPPAAAAAGASEADDPAATGPHLATTSPAAATAAVVAAAGPQGVGAATKEALFDRPATELAELLGDAALLSHWRAATAAQHQQAAWLGGRPAAAPTVAPPAPVWQQWCLQHHQQQQKQQVMAAAAQLKEAGAAGSSAAGYAAAVLAGLPAEDEAVQMAAAAVRYGQSLDQVLQSAWTAAPTKAATAAAPQQRSSYVKDPRSGRLKLVVEEGDPASQSFHAKELYGDLARWIDPVALEQSLTAAARAKRKAAAGGGSGGGIQEAGGVGAGSSSGGGKSKGASKKSRVVL